MRWRPGTHTVVYGGDDGQVALFDTDAAVQRGVSLPVFADAGAGDVQIATGDRTAASPYSRASAPSARRGRASSTRSTPADWLTHACSIVRRDLTPAEWKVYLPGRPYRPTCGES